MTIIDFKILASITTTLIIGMWTYYIFFAERTHSPKLEMAFETECYPFDSEYFLVSTKLKITNTSKVFLEPTSAQIKLQQILPNTKEFKGVNKNQFNVLDEGDDNLIWPMLGKRDWLDKEAPVKLEPGESDELVTDFFILKSAKVIRLYGSIQNPVTKLSWVKTKNIMVNENCNVVQDK